MDNHQLRDIELVFKANSEVKLVYLFGSKANGSGGPLSDYDFAVYLNERNRKRCFNIKLSLMDQLTRALKTDKVDIVLLNFARGAEIKYNIISEGRLIYEKEPFRLMVEPRILNEYFDFCYLLRKNNLTA